MLKIADLEISCFRSILNLKLCIESEPNLISICGENNVGKTNTLRAINLFFNPEDYEISMDRPTLKQAQGGARIDPKITVTLCDDENDEYFQITRDFKYYNIQNEKFLSGVSFTKRGTLINKKSKKTMTFAEIKSKLELIEFRYIESINIDIPDLIEKLTNDAIDVEYEQSRMTKSKQELKNAYVKYITGLQEILDVFSNDISRIFNEFKSNWNVTFKVPSSADTFRDLISDDVELLIDDKGCRGIEQKGPGLQRLAVILLNFEILKRIKHKKSYILCVDEPDIFLHDGLQKKLMEFFKESSDKMQIFYTTHSKNFINQYSMKNIILLGSKHYPQHSARKKRYIDVVETIFIDISTNDGYDQICEHLGIEQNTYNVLKKNNILVEGGCDKKYLEQLGDYFGFKKPNIISADGVTNVEKYLDFYNSYYKDNTTAYKPCVKVLFDNDLAGRDVYCKIKKDKYTYINVCPVLLCNFNNTSNMNLTNNTCNHEIEDYVYPEIICYLVNKLLQKKSFNTIDIGKVTEKIIKPAYQNNGILYTIEYEKNEQNQEEGHKISFVSAKKATNDIKNGLAGMFNIPGDRAIIELLEQCDRKYPYVKNFLKEIFTFE